MAKVNFRARKPPADDRLRDLFPEVTELRVVLSFDDESAWTPSPQSHAYFPAARGCFRYACPCHACNGEFDLTGQITALAGRGSHAPGNPQHLDLQCSGQRTHSAASTACGMRAHVTLTVIGWRERSADSTLHPG